MVTTSTEGMSLRVRPSATISKLADVRKDRCRRHRDFTGDMHVCEETGMHCVRSAGWMQLNLRPTALSLPSTRPTYTAALLLGLDLAHCPSPPAPHFPLFPSALATSQSAHPLTTTDARSQI